VQQTFQNIASLGRQRLVAIGAATIASLAIAAFGISLATSPEYRPISVDLTAAEAADVMRTLEQGGYSPKISSDGTMISLPQEDLARARMALAEEGFPAAGAAGWELFDDASGLGMNSFLQRVNRLRALEGELARSVQTIDAVDTARVHLVLPERESFSQTRPTPTASVIVKTHRGAPMERSKAIAIRNLISAAVPDLKPEDVTVLSASGETILADKEGITSAAANSKRAEIEERLARNIESIISARVGAGNVRVRVAADLETSREVFVQETYNPEEQVARKTSSLNEQSENVDGAANGVDAANNMPGLDLGGENAGGDRASKSKTLDEATYEIGSTRSERVTEAGGIKRLTVAILVNGTMENGTYTDRSADELERLASLARSAIGVDIARGDEVTVESLRFVGDAGLIDEEGGASAFEELIAANFSTILRSAGAVLIVALVLLIGVRPVIRAMIPREEAEEPTSNSANPQGEGGEEAEGPADGSDTSSTRQKESERSEYVSIESVSGGIMRRYVDELATLVEEDPETAARALKSWINQKG